jgi:hypothetical protein
MELQGAHDTIGGVNHVLDLAILVGGVGIRHLKLDTMRENESVGGVIKISFVTALDTLDGAIKLRGCIRQKSERGWRRC